VYRNSSKVVALLLCRQHTMCVDANFLDAVGAGPLPEKSSKRSKEGREN